MYLGHKEGAYWFYWGLIVVGAFTVVTYRKDPVSLSAGVAGILIGAAMLFLPPLVRGGWPLLRFAVLTGALASAVACLVASWQGRSHITAILAVNASALVLGYAITSQELLGRWIGKTGQSSPLSVDGAGATAPSKEASNMDLATLEIPDDQSGLLAACPRYSRLTVNRRMQGPVVTVLVQNTGEDVVEVGGLIFADNGIPSWPDRKVYALWSPATEPTKQGGSEKLIVQPEERVRLESGDTRRLIVARLEQKAGEYYNEVSQRWVIPYSWRGEVYDACCEWFPSPPRMPLSDIIVRITIVSDPPTQKDGVSVYPVNLPRDSVF